jgi:hypothetical protein
MYESTAQADLNDTALRIKGIPPARIDTSITGFNDAHKPVTNRVEAEYVPVYYTEPLEANLDSILFNLASCPGCNATISAARATSATLAAPPFKVGWCGLTLSNPS